MKIVAITDFAPATRRLTDEELAAIGFGPVPTQSQIDAEERAATLRAIAAMVDQFLRTTAVTLGATFLIGQALKAAGAL